MDVLIALGTTIAYVYSVSEVHTFTSVQHTFTSVQHTFTSVQHTFTSVHAYIY